ncbi:ABC transporter ATP-binding protein [Sphingobacteriales bacterium UPWRP_1]|nr:hypothetical protein B6N25_09710 [Sphingobacteriales bacterium TSM_CSS]PSJ74943.1 ABC transporter ATP-binding protein [Sphingobacteriales bacterium UPWRP_1]
MQESVVVPVKQQKMFKKLPVAILLPVLKQHKLLLLGALLCALADGIMRVIISAGVGVWVGQVLHHSTGKARFWDEVIGLQIDMNKGMLLLVGLKVLFAWSSAWLNGRTSETVARYLREQQFYRHLQLDLGLHLQKEKGKYLLRYTGDLGAVQSFLTKGVLQFTADMGFVLAAIYILSLISWRVPVYMGTWIAVCLLPVVVVSYFLRKTLVRRRDHRSILLNFVSQRLSAFFTVKAYNRETPEFNRFKKYSHKLYNDGIQYYFWSSLQTALTQVAVYGALLISLWYIATHTTGAVAENIAVFTLIMFYTIPVLRRLLQTNVVWQNGLVSLQKLAAFPAMKYPSEQLLSPISGSIALSNIWFTFPGAATPLFSGISLVIPAGGITCITGQSGSGKSTLLEIMAALYRPERGSISIDGKNYAQLHPFSLRKQIAIFSPDARLLGKTIFESVSYSRKKEKQMKVFKMLLKLGFNLNGVSQTEWLHYRPGDHGEKLSDSERQLIALARTFVTHKKIFLLDEPFAHLDENQQIPVVNLINRFSRKHTIVIAGEQIHPLLQVQTSYHLNSLHLLSSD